MERHRIVRALRRYLDREGFLEVQAPVLVRGTCPDRGLDSFAVGEDRYLCTSTEYHIKRLIVGGFPRVYTLGPNFRRGDHGERHNPEFTMLEWGRAGASMDRIERDAQALVNEAAGFERPFERVTVRDAIARHLGVDVDFSVTGVGAAVATLGGPRDWDADAQLSWLLDALQPHLGRERPVFLVEWPGGQTSSADAASERAELFIDGVEISDGFRFATDAAAVRTGFRAHLGRRGEPVALDERYLAALEEGLPPGAGMALGVDRLVMVLTGARRLRDVMAFGWEEL